MTLVTVSRQLGSLGHEVAVTAAQSLKYALIDRHFLRARLDDSEPSPQAMAFFATCPPERPPERAAGIGDTGDAGGTASAGSKGSAGGTRNLESSHGSDPPPQVMAAFAKAIRSIPPRRGIVLLGRGGQCLFHDTPGALHVQIVAPWELRLERVLAARPDLDAKQAAELLAESDRNRAAFVRYWFNRDWLDPTLYHVVLNTGLIPPATAALIITRMAREMARREAGAKTLEVKAPGERSTQYAFAHPSEEEFARLLDFYRIEWRYEPTTFPIEWDDAGNVTQAFTPDFYLPGLDLYVELTTAKQNLVTKKNRKIRRLHELYPDINLKVFYGRDFEKLFLKYGKNGTNG